MTQIEQALETEIKRAQVSLRLRWDSMHDALADVVCSSHEFTHLLCELDKAWAKTVTTPAVCFRRLAAPSTEFLPTGGILDRTGERQCADNSGKGGDGAPTPGGGGAPEQASERFQLRAHVRRSAGANSFASARHISAQRG
jgi:hypothetical protein